MSHVLSAPKIPTPPALPPVPPPPDPPAPPPQLSATLQAVQDQKNAGAAAAGKGFGGAVMSMPPPLINLATSAPNDVLNPRGGASLQGKATSA